MANWPADVTRPEPWWVDFDNDYKTSGARSLMESVIWVFKQLWKKRGWPTRATGSARTAGNDGTPLFSPDVLMDDDVYVEPPGPCYHRRFQGGRRR